MINTCAKHIAKNERIQQKMKSKVNAKILHPIIPSWRVTFTPKRTPTSHPSNATCTTTTRKHPPHHLIHIHTHPKPRHPPRTASSPPHLPDRNPPQHPSPRNRAHSNSCQRRASHSQPARGAQPFIMMPTHTQQRRDPRPRL